MKFSFFRSEKLKLNVPTSIHDSVPATQKTFFGTDGSDIMDHRSDLKRTEIHGGLGSDTIDGSKFGDWLYGDWGADHIDGWDGNDRIFGGQGRDVLIGNRGDDWLYGGDEGDTIYGLDDNDHLYGDHGEDFLSGGKGTDILWGGQGNDTFAFDIHLDGIIPAYGSAFAKQGAIDQIMDFSVGDHIQIFVKRHQYDGSEALGDMFDNCSGQVQIQSGSDMSDARRGFVFDETTDMLYFDTGSSGFAIAQVHGSAPTTVDLILSY